MWLSLKQTFTLMWSLPRPCYNWKHFYSSLEHKESKAYPPRFPFKMIKKVQCMLRPLVDYYACKKNFVINATGNMQKEEFGWEKGGNKRFPLPNSFINF